MRIVQNFNLEKKNPVMETLLTAATKGFFMLPEVSFSDQSRKKYITYKGIVS